MLSRTHSGRRPWQGLLSVGLLSSVISAAAAADERAAAHAPAAGIEAEVTGGLLTLHADGAPLADVLRAIGEAGAFEVALRGTFAMPVRESFEGRPLEETIRALLAGHSVIILRADATRLPRARAAGAGRSEPAGREAGPRPGTSGRASSRPRRWR